MYKPNIRHVAAKIATIERRADRLSQQIANNEGSQASLGFAKAELAAIEAGVEALRWHRVSNGEMDDPVAALAELVEAVENPEPVDGAAALGRAKEVLQTWTQSLTQEVLANENAGR